MTGAIVGNAADDGAQLRNKILDTALALGEQAGWDAVQLHAIAQAMGITLADIHRHYPQKDAIAEAWFDRADEALLAAPALPGWKQLSVPHRLHGALFAWLGALAPHRRITCEMLRYKLHPEHVHLQALGAMRNSRTVQWIREVAFLPSAGWRREVEEAALTAIYLSAFAYWLNDASPGARRTHAFVDRLLRLADRAALALALTARAQR